VGCEISEAAGREARNVLDEVHVFDIEADWPEPLRRTPFDVVVLGEILEHVFDPVVVLSHARSVLAPGGRIVITTPNFLVWIARLQVLFGRFRYQEYGLFDFGHIRFFTYAYLKQVLDRAGFVLDEERHMLHPATLPTVFFRWPSLFALHFVVSAHPRP
jgi:SAM-dependent methyltransferase